MTDVRGYSLDEPIYRDEHVVVWRAIREKDNVPVLLKTHDSPDGYARLEQRLRRDFTVGTALDSPFIARYFDLIVDERRVAVVQEHVDGVPLETSIPPDGLPIALALDVAIQLAEALRAVHARRFLHNDLAPRSVLLTRDSHALKVFDLGAARRFGDIEPEVRSNRALHYVAPEHTGRMSAEIDVRSDLYALGATLYHVVCGRPPFDSSDPLEVVHSHLAKLPADPRALRPSAPRALSEIILKLLAKHPEQRYQSTEGLLADLLECRSRFARGDSTGSFPLGRHDVAPAFHLPNRLYGRNAEIEELRGAFERASGGRAELVVVTGYSGTGKSVLVDELRTPALERRGFFLVGKFEQLTRGVPYGAIRQAFHGLVHQLLAAPTEQTEAWRSAVRRALGDQGQVLIEVIPELESLIGPQPAVERLGPVETQYRFTRLFRELVRVFATTAHPLVLFLDDWQWADPASLHLLEALLTTPDPQALLMVGAYRDDEVEADHPALALIEGLRQRHVPVSRIAVNALSSASILQFLTDALRRDDPAVNELGAEVQRRTGGNPFFVRSFLRNLHDAGILTASAGGDWRWDSSRLAEVPPAENVVSLIADRIGRLPEATRRLLEVGSCVGSAFSSSLLATASGVAEQDLQPHLTAAADAGVLVRDGGVLRFLHDRVQEAAHSIIPRDSRPRLQLEIGRRLTAELARDDVPQLLVQAVGHLNAGRTLITDRDERLRLAQMNLRAGRLARRSSAYVAAAEHAAIGMEIIGDAGWQSDYELALALHELRAECEYLAGNFEVAERLYPVALSHTRSDLDAIRILNVQKDQYELQGRYLDAIAVLRRGLGLVGIAFPDNDVELEDAVRKELREIPVNLRGRAIASLVDSPPITDPVLIATLKMLMGMWPSCYVAGLQPLLALVSVKIANFSLRHGNCEISSAAYVNYSFVAGFVTGDYDQALEFGKVGMALADRYPERSVRAWCNFLFGCGTLIWRAPLREGRPYLERAVALGIESGNIACASYAASYIVTDGFMQGLPLGEVRSLYEQYFPFLKRSNPAIHLFGELGTQSLRSILGLHALDEGAFRATYGQVPFFAAVYHFGKLAAAYLSDDHDAVELARRAVESVPRLLPGTFKVPETLFYAALISARAARRRAQDPLDEELRTWTGELRDRLASFATHCPENVAHKVRLVEAELARLDGHVLEATVAYEQAASLARDNGFTQDEALAFELAARFWSDHGVSRLAGASLEDAITAYERWGDARRARLLRHRQTGLAPSEAAPGPIAPTRTLGDSLDLLSVAKASQVISGEIDFERLLNRLMRIVSENAGARRSMLFLREGEELVLAAEIDIGGDRVAVAPRRPLNEAGVPTAIVRHVAESNDVLVLHDARREGPFVHDPDVTRRALRSVLCLPVRHKDATTGVLYLENDLNAGVFTAERTAVLELLMGQVAISLENARLYGELRASIERAEEAKEQAERANRAKDEFLAMLGHELRNPLAPILTACELMRLKAPNELRREREVIDRQLRHVIRLVDDLLDVSRIARGKIELRPQPVTVAEIVARAIEAVEPLFEQRRVRLETDVVPEARVFADPARLRQIVGNLLNNAAKFSSVDGTVWLSARIARGEVVISVRDHGIGIAPDMLPRVFDPFVQGSQAVDRRAGGLGLGLAIAKSLTAMHNGTISVASDGLGCGAVFEVTLPLYDGVHESIVGRDSRGRGVTGRRVLVVDDNRDAAELLAEALATVGHVPLVAYDAATALEMMARDLPDAALFDIGLPLIDGYELARRTRTLAGGRRIVLIAVTGYGLPGDRARCMDAGFDAHLAKPVDLDDIQRTLEAFVRA